MISFQNPYFLIGTGAAAIPILIFLLTRDRIKKVAFSTLRFFAGTSATLIKRKRWQEAVLLAMRVGVCVLLALAFARPFLPSPNVTPQGQMRVGRAVAVVVDVSASMTRPGAFDQARQIIKKTVDGLPADAAVTLVAFDRTPRVELPWTRDTAKFDGTLAVLQPGSGGTDIVAAVRKADEALEQIAADDKQILLVSDMQRIGWEGFQGSWKLHAGVTLSIQPVKVDKTVDYAIADADYPQSIVKDGQGHSMTLRIACYAQQAINNVPVTLTLNGKEVETQRVNLPAGGNAIARFTSKFEQIGDNRGVIQVGAGGALGSTLYFNTRVVPKIAVLILSGAAGSSKADAAFFLQTALTPTEESPFVVQTLPAERATATDVAGASVVMLADVDAASPGLKAALRGVLERGGGLLFLPGSHVTAEAFSATFGELAPCGLRRTMAASETRRGDAKAMLTRIDYDNPILEVFQRPHFGDFSAVQFERYWEVTDSQLSKVLARFDDGRPYLLTRSIANGNSILWASPPDLRWNNLPTRAIFLPFLHQITRTLAQHTEPQTRYFVGDILPVPAQSTLSDPAGQLHKDGGFMAGQTGYYAVLDGAGKVMLTYAVNGDMGEMNPAVVDVAEVQAALAPPARTGPDIAAHVAGLAGQAGKEFWLYTVAAVLLLTVSELVVSNRVARH